MKKIIASLSVFLLCANLCGCGDTKKTHLLM